MAPNLFGNSATIYLEASQQQQQQQEGNAEKPSDLKIQTQKLKNTQNPQYQWKIVWRNVIAFVYLHVGAIYGLYLCFTVAHPLTLPFNLLAAVAGGIGITAGAHRLWAHKAYKAKWPMRLILTIFQTMAFQNHIYEWVRDHRCHHKFTDTDGDPHNAKRGFFFSHMGWLLIRKHPDVMKKGVQVDMSDLDKDFFVVWQKRLYIILMPVFCFLLPMWIPCYFWGEKPMYSWYATIFRYTASLNATWLVNSAAHIWGMKPYDRAISATDNIRVALGAFGEGWHNYHHAFPWDYKAAELGDYKANLTTAFIDFFAKLGWAYDLKTVPLSMIEKRAARTGDGSRMPRDKHHHHDHHDHHDHEGAIWGWGDKDMDKDEIANATIFNKGD